MEKEIYKSQISTLRLAKKYLKNCRSKGVDIETSPLCDFVTWSNCLGYQKLLLLNNKRILSFNFLKILTYELLGVRKNSKFLKYSTDIKSKGRINIVYSYCSKENFSKQGLFYDYYFNQSSADNKNTYWFLVSSDNYIPKKSRNVFIIYREKKIFDFFYLLKFLLKNSFKKNIIHNCNNTSNVSDFLSKFFYETFNGFKFNLYMPYESRPHQNAIIKIAKKISRENKIYGYYHRMPEPFQSEMIYKTKDLDKLYVCSKIQKNIFCKYFSWPTKTVKVINSLRFMKFSKRKNFIFLPFEIKNKEFFLNKLVSLTFFKNTNTKKIKISIHPLKRNSKKHLDFKNKINKSLKMIKKNKSKIYKSLDAPIILGEPGGVASEILQTIGKVYHISDSFFDIFSEKIWKNIKVIKISESVYKYVKLKGQNFSNINGKKGNFKQLLNQNKAIG